MNTPSRHAIRSVRCPHCGAPENEPCIGVRDKERTAHHIERVHEATRNANGPTGRSYDREQHECPLCDGTGLVIVSDDHEPDPLYSARSGRTRRVTRYGPCPRCNARAAS